MPPSHIQFKTHLFCVVAIALFIIAQPAAAAAQGCSAADFRVAPNLEVVTGGAFPRPVYAAGDLNGDGKLDFAVTDSFVNAVIVLINDGAGGFGLPQKYAAGARPAFVAIADVNGDGRLDLLVTNSESNNVSVLLGTGGGAFSGPTNFAVGTDPRAIGTSDFNGDGFLDLAVGNVGNNLAGSVSVLLGNGGGSFSNAAGSPIGIEGQAVSIAVADFNLDGKRDLAVATFNGFFVLLGNGSGGFAAPVKIYDLGGGSIASADFNNDGKPDLALGANALVIRLGDGSGGFAAPVVIPHEGGARLAQVAIADIDGDGKLDVAASAELPSGITFFKGDGAGAFTRTRSYLAATNSGSFATGDFDGDADQDFVAGNSILVNTGGGVFEAVAAVYISADIAGSNFVQPLDIALGDFNADGRSDMAVLQAPARIAILLRDASGNFTQSSTIPFFNGSGLTAVVAADFNHDGKSDIAAAGTLSIPFTRIVSISLSNGDGTFTSQNITINQDPFDLAVGDFNGDSHPDLIVVPRNANFSTVLLGNGTGGFFMQGVGPNFGADFPSVAVADLNGDTKLDLIVTDFFQQRVLTILGEGNGFFSTLRSFALPGNPSSVAVADFNVDGKRDLAIASQGAFGSSFVEGPGAISFLAGDGTGAFAAAVNYPAGAQVEGILTADLDGDGKLDLAVANQASSSISVLSGDNLGAFRAPVSFAVWGGPATLVVDDFNGDGRNDLAAPLTQSSAVGILYGKAALSQPCLFVDDLAVTEGDSPTPTNMTVRLSEASGQIVKVNYLFKNQGATEGLDYTGGTGTLIFQPGETSKLVPTTILVDAIDEDVESFTLNLSNAVNARISDGVGKVNITDNDPPPTMSIDDVTITEGDSPFNFSTVTFTVSLSGPSSHTIQVAYATSNGTATAGPDFDQTTGGLFFGVGETTKTFAVAIRGDLTFEPDETFFVNLSNPIDATIVDGQGQGTILNNDPVPAITVSEGTTSEGVSSDVSMTLTIQLSNASSLPITVNYATAGGDTATPDVDYISASGTVTFNPGENLKTISVTIKHDTIDEANEVFFMNISQPVNATIARAQGRCTILDNDGPAVSVNDVTVPEGQGGLTTATFTLTLSAASPQAVVVRLATANGTASSPFDFQSTIRFVNIPAGSTTATTNLSVIGDLTIEPDETFFVNLSQPQNCTIDDGQGVGTILNDDTTSVQFSTDAITVNEADGKVEVTVLRVGQTTGPFTAVYQTFRDTASDRSDYNEAIGTLQFAPGETNKTFTIFVTNDAFPEPPEVFGIQLSGPNGAATNPPSFLIVTINSDDISLGPNPINASDFFVRQHYRDFLNRDPDPAGLAFWIDQIESCGADTACREVKRINVSAAFFLSIEFQETGYLAYRAYNAAYGDTTSPNVTGTVPIIRLNEFLNDAQLIGHGVQVGIGNWQQQLEDNKNAYVLEFVQRSRFLSSFPTTMTADEFVTKLNQRSGGVLSADQQAQLIAILGATPSDPTKRASVLRKVAEDSDLNQRELNRAFVLMQYYGYLRRNPDDFPNLDFSGWKFWLDKLNQFGGNFVQAEMVKAFILSGEYRGRFGN